MSVNPSPIGGYAGQFFDNNGQPLSGGKIYTYAAGTTTPQATYTSSLGVTPHANPIVLDSAGRVPGGEIWLTDGLIYKFVIETATAILIGSYDNISGVNSNFVNYAVQEEVQTATAGQTVFNLTTINYTPGTNSLSVYVDGVNQYVGDSYLETDSNTVTFTAGLHVGAEVKFTTAVTLSSASTTADLVGYTPPFTGGVATNVEAKLSQYVSVKDFGAVGDGVTDDTVAIQAALNWLAGGPRRTLNWDIQTTLISSALSLPDASEWTLNFTQVSRITQATDNTPIFLMEPSASRYGFELTGAPVWFQWANNQTGADTKSIGVAFKPTTALPDGVYGWEMHTLYNENGYDLLALHPDSVTAATVCTFWGFQIDKLYHQTNAVGRVFALNSGGGGGSPGSIINAIYIKATNVAASNAMFVKGHAGLRINVIEVNAAFKRALYFESCISPSIGVLRFEIATLTSGEDLMSVAGSTTVMTIDNLEFQAIDTSASAGAAYGIVAFGGAQINVVGGLTVRDCVASNAGRFYVFRPQTDGSKYGRIILPPAASVQKTDNYLQLHTYTEATYVTSSAGIPVGPFFKASVAAVPAFTPMVAFWDGANNFFDITCPADGYITSIQVALSSAVSAGSIRFYIYKNGSAITGYLATVSSGTSGSAFAPLAWAPQSINANHKVVRGDLLRVMVEPLTATGGGDATATLFISQLAD